MKVKLTQQISGTRNGERWPAPGEEITLDDDEGAALCDAGLAEPVASKESDRSEKRSKSKE